MVMSWVYHFSGETDVPAKGEFEDNIQHGFKEDVGLGTLHVRRSPGRTTYFPLEVRATFP